MNEPTWDLSSYFPSFESDERAIFVQQLESDLSGLQEKVASLDPISSANLNDWITGIEGYEHILVRFEHLRSYLGCLTSCDVTHEGYQHAEAALSRLGAEVTKVRIELLRGFRDASELERNALLSDPRMKGAEWFVHRIQEEAMHQMQAQQEALAAELAVDGIQAWGRLYSLLSGKMTFEMTFPDGKTERVSMARRRGLMADSNRDVRKEAFLRGNEAWAAQEDVMGAALNAMAGTRLTLNRHRGIEHFLDVPLFDSALDRKTLEAMNEGIEGSIAALHEALKQAAIGIGVERLDWFDLEAPMPSWSGVTFSWEEGIQTVGKAFARVYPEFAAYYESALERRWVDAASRPGRIPGAYCTGSRLKQEERIFINYSESLNDLMTLAHEFGHAWHSHLLEKSHRPLASSYPMTLAETASTFGESLFLEGLRQDPACDALLSAAIADVEANRLHSFLVNIPVRFAFEKAFYTERSAGEVSVRRLKELMVESQRKYYGETLGETDPYFWASKLHFFITDLSFYNFPYAFGYLLSRAMFFQFKKEGSGFLRKYEAFLINSGKMTCEEAAGEALGVNLKDPSFWAGAVSGK